MALESEAGLRARILSFGAILQSMEIKIGGAYRDIVLGLQSEDHYVQSMMQPYPPVLWCHRRAARRPNRPRILA